MRIFPLARVNIGDDTFHWGDGKLQDVSVTLGEGKNSSSCRFTVYDPDRTIIDKYLARIEEIGGLEPVEAPERGGKRVAGSKSGTRSTELSAEERAFLDVIAYAEGADYDTLLGGATFTDFTRHPEVYRADLNSDAAGRYQFLSTTWKPLGYPDFTPKNQDQGAIDLIQEKGALDDVRNGDIVAAVSKLGGTWASFPTGSQSRTTLEELEKVYENSLVRYSDQGQRQEEATESITKEKQPNTNPRAATLAGSQITIALGLNGNEILLSSFLHTGISYTQNSPHSVEFSGKAAVWVLAQRKKTTAYTNITLKELTEKVVKAKGLNLDWQAEDESVTYEYLPQRGQSDYQLLLKELHAQGFRITNKGNTVTVKSRADIVNQAAYTLNLEGGPLEFSLSHEAQGASSGGARSTDPSERRPTGERKYVIDPDSGSVVSLSEESITGAKDSDDQQEISTGSNLSRLTPLVVGDKKANNTEAEKNEDRIRGIKANFTTVTNGDLLTLNPDSVFYTQGFSTEIDRVWVIESLTHNLSRSSYTSTGILYSPMRNKYPSSEFGGGSDSANSKSGANLSPGALIKPSAGVRTSPFGPRGGRQHRGVDISDGRGADVWASERGVVIDSITNCEELDRSCGGGFGNRVYIDHGEGVVTRYAHLEQGSVTVALGDTVEQGEVIGTEGNTGASNGAHLHWEVLKNGVQIDPESVVKI